MKTTVKGGSSQDRRRARRAAERASQETVDVLVAGAQGGSFDLGDREERWDADAAEKSYDLPGDSDCYMWKDPEGDPAAKSSYKLAFVSKSGGKHAVWGAITAIAGALSGARGGVDIPAADKDAVKSKVGGYYAKASKKYDDPSIKVPWEASADATELELEPTEDPGDRLGAEMAAEFRELGLRAVGAKPRSAAQRRRAVLDELVAAGDPGLTPTITIEQTNCSDAYRYWAAAAMAAGYVELAGDAWPTEADGPGDVPGVLLRDDGEVVLKLGDGSLVLLSVRFGWVRAHVAAPSADGIPAAFASFRERYPASYTTTADDGRVPITFWMNTPMGPSPRLRRIDSASWEDVERNYSADVRGELGDLMAWDRPGRDGQLFLWQGPPGTGKTWALRALASEWGDWAEFHYITDPDQFFVHDPSYMVNVLLADSYATLDEDGELFEEDGASGKWRVLILEDTGELLAENAKDSYGQGLSRLLNVVDGMIGQGLRVLALVTTNDELGELHPAVKRPGRCASSLTFGPLSRDEANLWLADHSSPGTVLLPRDSEGATLAELYAHAAVDGVEAFQEPDGDEPAPGMPCDNCDHTYAAHPDGGACTMQDCSCSSFVSGEMSDHEPPNDDGDEMTAVDGRAAVTIRLAQAGYDRLVEAAGAGILDVDRLTFELSDFEIVPAVEATVPDPSGSTGGIPWRAVLCPEGVPTDDGRIFAPGAISWRPLPLTLMGLIETSALGGHDKAELAGRIDNIWRDGSLIRAEGVFDDGEFGSKVAELVGDESLRGVSVDLAVAKVEMAYRADILDEEGHWIGTEPGDAEADPWDVMADPDAHVTDLMLVVWDAKIGMATVCPFQAFEPATIEVATLAAGGAANPIFWRFSHDAGWRLGRSDEETDMAADRAALVASLAEIAAGVATHRAMTLEEAAEAISRARLGGSGLLLAAATEAPVAPPADWFRDPELSGPTPLTITEDGRIYGHAAVWETCHMSYADVCVSPPHSATEYSYFLLGEIETDDGLMTPVGKITMDTGHAPRTLSRTATVRHYDDTGTVVAHVVAGEDDHGIWFSGGLVPGLSDEKVRLLRGSSLSGDWRDANGLELVALLAVNVPGFPVPRPRAMVAAGEGFDRVIALTAAGVLSVEEPVRDERLAAQFAAIGELADGGWEKLRARAGEE